MNSPSTLSALGALLLLSFGRAPDYSFIYIETLQLVEDYTMSPLIHIDHYVLI